MTDLTPREAEIAVMICAADMTAREVASDLGISVNTVKTHTTNLRKRFEAKSMNRVCYRVAVQRWNSIHLGGEAE